MMNEKELWYNEKIINALLKEKPFGFANRQDIKGSFALHKKNGNRLLYFGCGSILKNGLLTGVGAGISFFEIEEILDIEFKKNPIYDNGATITTRNHSLIFNKEPEGGIYKELPIILDSEAAMERATALIHKFIKESALPFFDYWTDIRCFLPFIETDDGRKLNDYFASYPLERKLIIWHLCNHPKSKQLSSETLKSWQEYSLSNPRDAIFKRRLKNMIRVISELSKTEPIYEWDDKYLISKPFQV